jgi:DNA-binding CsgD family transcriptional regulator
MLQADAFSVFDSLTQKQHEALKLASDHLTSKQIALAVGVAPVTIDKRIEAVRARLDYMPRSDLLRLYRLWSESDASEQAYGQIISDQTILGLGGDPLPITGSQPADRQLVFEDSMTFDERASWERSPFWLRPDLKPSDLGVSGKLAVMLGGAVAIMMIAVLCMAFVDALMSILLR